MKMTATRRGIYHNLRNSKYSVSNTEIEFFFSSRFYMKKFMNNYVEHRETFRKRFEQIMKRSDLNTDFLADLNLYKDVEKRGFYCLNEGVETSWQNVHQYALVITTKKNTLNWHVNPERR